MTNDQHSKNNENPQNEQFYKSGFNEETPKNDQ